MRLRIPLNNGWKSLARPPREFTHVGFDDGAWASVRLPHTSLELPLDHADPVSLHFITGYRRTLIFHPDWSGQRVFLVFEGVMARAEVWVDGEQFAEHRGGYTPFEVEIPAEAVTRGSAVVAVVADATPHPEIPPYGGIVDYLAYGGMYREARLEVRPHRYLDTLTVETPSPGHGHWKVRGSLFLDFLWNDPIPLIGTARVFDPDTGEELAHGAVGWAPGSLDAPYELEVPGATAWNAAHPKLYELRVEINEDTLERRFGFRTADFKPDGFYLNGTKLKLRGLNRHQSWPVVGNAMPRRAQAADADLVRALGCNVVRSSHYPPSRHFLDRCDEIGLLVLEELPGWQHIGGPIWKDTALQNLEEMILRDRHHPSVVLWGTRINESPDDDAFYKATNALAKRLDPTRATGGVRNFAGSHLYEDVYTYNDFLHDGTKPPLAKPKKVAKKPVPYLVTEHNGHMFPTKKDDHESRRVEHALRHARVQNAAAAQPDNAGALGWCLADYATNAEFGSGDQICHHGVVDQFRCAKPAAWFYASQGEAPFGAVAGRFAPGDHDASLPGPLWVFTNSEEVRVSGGVTGTFRPSRRFGALPHPPVVIDDLVGDRFGAQYKLSAGDTRTVRRAFAQFFRDGRPRFFMALAFAWVRLKRGWSRRDVENLYAGALYGWGTSARTLVLEGWTAGTKQWEASVGPAHGARLELTLDTHELQEGDTYDVVRAQVRLLDNLGRELWYGNDAAVLEVEGPLAVQGPSARALQGGSTAFWLASTGTGTARLRVRAGLWSAEAEVTIR